jgi:hypothetical protein
MNTTFEREVLEILSKAKVPLSESAIGACMALREDININSQFLQLILDGHFEVSYLSDKSDNVLDIRNYDFKMTEKAKTR